MHTLLRSKVDSGKVKPILIIFLSLRLNLFHSHEIKQKLPFPTVGEKLNLMIILFHHSSSVKAIGTKSNVTRWVGRKFRSSATFRATAGPTSSPFCNQQWSHQCCMGIESNIRSNGASDFLRWYCTTLLRHCIYTSFLFGFSSQALEYMHTLLHQARSVLNFKNEFWNWIFYCAEKHISPPIFPSEPTIGRTQSQWRSISILFDQSGPWGERCFVRNVNSTHKWNKL